MGAPSRATVSRARGPFFSLSCLLFLVHHRDDAGPRIYPLPSLTESLSKLLITFQILLKFFETNSDATKLRQAETSPFLQTRWYLQGCDLRSDRSGVCVCSLAFPLCFYKCFNHPVHCNLFWHISHEVKHNCLLFTLWGQRAELISWLFFILFWAKWEGGKCTRWLFFVLSLRFPEYPPFLVKNLDMFTFFFLKIKLRVRSYKCKSS